MKHQFFKKRDTQGVRAENSTNSFAHQQPIEKIPAVLLKTDTTAYKNQETLEAAKKAEKKAALKKLTRLIWRGITIDADSPWAAFYLAVGSLSVGFFGGLAGITAVNKLYPIIVGEQAPLLAGGIGFIVGGIAGTVLGARYFIAHARDAIIEYLKSEQAKE